MLKTDKYLVGCNAAIIAQQNELYTGRNLDVTFSDGFWVINQRNIKKTAYMPFDAQDAPISWASQHGSITINALHIDIPLGGMNEQGLVVEHLALENSKFPEKNERKAITPFQWIQYQLDNYSTVDEVVASEKWLRINPWIFGFMHFLVCDAQGNMAIIEYQKAKNGKSQRLVYRNSDFPEYFWALGNAPYADHVAFMRQFKAFGGKIAIPTDKTTIDKNTKYQFAISAKMLKDFDPKHNDPEKYLFAIMEKVRQNTTQVIILYNPANKIINFKTTKNLHEQKINIKKLEFSSKKKRCALFWHDENLPCNWNANIAWINNHMLEHFAEFFWLDTFKFYKEDLKNYVA